MNKKNMFHFKPITIVLLICQLEQVVRFIFTIIRYKKGYWLNNLTVMSPSVVLISTSLSLDATWASN